MLLRNITAKCYNLTPTHTKVGHGATMHLFCEIGEYTEFIKSLNSKNTTKWKSKWCLKVTILFNAGDIKGLVTPKI